MRFFFILSTVVLFSFDVSGNIANADTAPATSSTSQTTTSQTISAGGSTSLPWKGRVESVFFTTGAPGATVMSASIGYVTKDIEVGLRPMASLNDAAFFGGGPYARWASHARQFPWFLEGGATFLSSQNNASLRSLGLSTGLESQSSGWILGIALGVEGWDRLISRNSFSNWSSPRLSASAGFIF